MDIVNTEMHDHFMAERQAKARRKSDTLRCSPPRMIGGEVMVRDAEASKTHMIGTKDMEGQTDNDSFIIWDS